MASSARASCPRAAATQDVAAVVVLAPVVVVAEEAVAVAGEVVAAAAVGVETSSHENTLRFQNDPHRRQLEA